MAQAFVQHVYEQRKRQRRQNVLPKKEEVKKSILELVKKYIEDSSLQSFDKVHTDRLSSYIQKSLIEKWRKLFDEKPYKLIVLAIFVEDEGQGICYQGAQSCDLDHDLSVKATVNALGFYGVINAYFIRSLNLADKSDTSSSSESNSNSSSSDSSSEQEDLEENSESSSETDDSATNKSPSRKSLPLSSPRNHSTSNKASSSSSSNNDSSTTSGESTATSGSDSEDTGSDWSPIWLKQK